MTGTSRLVHVAFGFPLSAFCTSAFGQGTAFTYQGRLNDGGTAAIGTYDLRFTLRDALANGSPVGGLVDAEDVGATNGLFTVTLDLGGTPFDGSARWLEIADEDGKGHGVLGTTRVWGGDGVRGEFRASSGYGAAVAGYNYTASGWAGYFVGRPTYCDQSEANRPPRPLLPQCHPPGICRGVPRPRAKIEPPFEKEFQYNEDPLRDHQKMDIP